MRPSLEKPTFIRPMHAGPRAADERLFLAADPHHHRRIGLLREQRGNNQRDACRDLAAEAAAGIFADEHDFAHVDVQPSRDGGHGLRRALRAGVNVDLAVLPVGHRAAGLERLMAGVRRDEGFIEHQRRILEPGVDVAVRPFVGRLAHRQTPVLRLREFLLGPLERSDRRRWRSWRRSSRDGRRSRRLYPDVSVRSGIGAAGAQGLERIDDEGKRFKIDSNLFNRFGSSELVHGGHGENRLALVKRLHGERLLALRVGPNHRAIVGECVGWRRKFVGRENRFHAGHRQRLRVRRGA